MWLPYDSGEPMEHRFDLHEGGSGTHWSISLTPPVPFPTLMRPTESSARVLRHDPIDNQPSLVVPIGTLTVTAALTCENALTGRNGRCRLFTPCALSYRS